MTPTPVRRINAQRAIGAIPHTLSDYRCVDFVNSRFNDHTGGGQVFDRLKLDEWRRWFAQRCGLSPERPPSAAMLRRLTTLRAMLRLLLESGQPPGSEAIEQLNRLLSDAPQHWQLSRQQRDVILELRWQHNDWRSVMAVTIASYGALISGGGITRIKACANPDCTYMFYDDTRNRSRRWCDAGACGNLLRVRRFRNTGDAPRTPP